jgi:DNA-binding NtrC family response regulator
MHSPNNIPTADLAREYTRWKRSCQIGARDKRTRLIVVGPFDEDLVVLLGILGRTNWDFSWWTSCAETVATLREEIVPVVVVCECDMPDGRWQTLLAELPLLREPPLLIFTSRRADERLWAEAVNLGAYDVLGKPFDPAEVVHVISSAFRAWHSNREARTPKKKLEKGA